jgi:hypothetical protein
LEIFFDQAALRVSRIKMMQAADFWNLDQLCDDLGDGFCKVCSLSGLIPLGASASKT